MSRGALRGFGLQLPIQSQSRLYVAPWELAAGPEDLVRVARAADDAGLLYVAVCDHVAVPEAAAERMGTFWCDPIATLGLLAGATARVRLLSHVYVPAYRHPLVTAKSFATLDWLSGGRVVIGVGAGHVGEEFAALGADFARRGAVLDEAIDVIAAALEREWVGGVAVAPRPVQRPRPPIWVGGSSPAAIRRAATRGDGWLPQGPASPEQIATLRALRSELRPDEPIAIGTIAPFLVDALDASDQAVDRLGHLAGGVDHVQVRFKAGSCDELVDQIDAFAASVMPHVSFD